MKKVTNITLGGIVFAVEEDAYEKLSAYLSGIEKTFKQNDDYAEIAADIESAIAEKFLRAKKNEKRAVTLSDVERVMDEMGHAKDLAEESGETTETETDPADEKTENLDKEPARRLYRDTDDAILGGVCSGIANYFSIDPVLVRVAFVILAFLNGIGVLFYILLWLIVPAAVTQAEKYAMRGEQMTITHITERVKKKINNIDAPDLSAAKGVWSSLRNVLEKVFSLAGKVIMFGLQALRYLVGFILTLLGALGIAILVSVLSVVWPGDYVWPIPEVGMLMDIILGVAAGHVFLAAFAIAVSAMLIVTIMTGACLLVGRNIFTLTKSLSLLVIWIVAVGVMITLAALYAPAFVEEAREVERWHNEQQIIQQQ